MPASNTGFKANWEAEVIGEGVFKKNRYNY